MDKRNLLGIKKYSSKNQIFDVYIYQKKSGNKTTLRTVYGTIEVYITKNISVNFLNKMIIDTLQKYPNKIINRPFYKEGEYFYILGQKKIITRDVSLKDNDNYFYIRSTCKDEITPYKKQALSFFKKRILEIGKLMDIDLSSYSIYSGLFISYYGCCFPIKKQLKFDYRLYAYTTNIIDSIIIHELAHILELSHSKNFYNIVYKYCPNYDKLTLMLNEGRFDEK